MLGTPNPHELFDRSRRQPLCQYHQLERVQWLRDVHTILMVQQQTCMPIDRE